MGWGYGYWFPPFGFFFALLAAFLIFGVIRLILFRRFGPWGIWGPGPWRRGWYGHPSCDAEALLRRRLASGEITDAEYQRLKDILSK
jgi:uncharacterized membrane protein